MSTKDDKLYSTQMRQVKYHINATTNGSAMSVKDVKLTYHESAVCEKW